MAKLIDADFLVESLCREKAVLLTDTRLSKSQRTELKKLTQLVIDVLNAAPAVDNMSHGEWKDASALGDIFWKCSCCGFLSEATGAPVLYKFCQNCGAKMDGDNNA